MCPCKVTLRPGDSVAWCYNENCPHTDRRFPSGEQVAEFKIEPTTLNRPGWEPGMKRPKVEA